MAADTTGRHRANLNDLEEPLLLRQLRSRQFLGTWRIRYDQWCTTQVRGTKLTISLWWPLLPDELGKLPVRGSLFLLLLETV
jgi:hypothetical protein